MVNSLLLLVCALTFILWLVQELRGRPQIQKNFEQLSSQSSRTDPVTLRGLITPSWIPMFSNLMLAAWIAWAAILFMNKDGDFAVVMVVITFLLTIIGGLDKYIFEKNRERYLQTGKPAEVMRQFTGEQREAVKQSLAGQMGTAENARSFFPVLIVVLFLRSFVFEPFQIPSASMEPTLLTGDYIIVDKYSYGLRLPVVGTKILETGEPERGDVMVFFPPGDSRYFIKRVIGLPGDKISYVNKVLYVNGEKVNLELVSRTSEYDAEKHLLLEKLGDVEHLVHINKRGSHPSLGNFEVTVDEGHYYMMGDNRDNSSDSRVWGQVPEDRIVGKATAIWMHWPGFTQLPQFSRMGWVK